MDKHLNMDETEVRLLPVEQVHFLLWMSFTHFSEIAY